ncbi:transposase-like zinc-binding domain-containing protein [Burkholderia sp. BCC1977]|uniref:IS1/IS1595 family N-terminal zinc-binding domain-containing protein n=1 Tax=Burkholderia sp. BCC1977 TaxID=2817440 RepID=UPI0039F24EF7
MRLCPPDALISSMLCPHGGSHASRPLSPLHARDEKPDGRPVQRARTSHRTPVVVWTSHRNLEPAHGPTRRRHCGRLSVVKNGRAHGLQHYFCLDCNRTSIVTTNTSLAKLRQKEGLPRNAAMAAGMAVSDTAAAQDVVISPPSREHHCFGKGLLDQQPTATLRTTRHHTRTGRYIEKV